MYSIILNPLSGNGQSAKTLPALCALLDQRNISYRVDETHTAGDATRLAANAVRDGLEGVIAMGGDGTFSETANGIGESGLELIFAPCGTGNDFMRMFDLPKDTLEAVRKQLDSPSRRIDLGKCNDRYFLNVAGTGFDVDVLIQADKYKPKYQGLQAYLRGAYAAIRQYWPRTIRLTVDGGEEQEVVSSILSVGNGSYIGGGMKAVPGAKVDDGLFDVVLASAVKKSSLYILLVYFVLGKHTKMKNLCKTFFCKTIRIVSEGMIIEADGEMFPCEDATISILPKALRTRLPV